MSQQKHQVEEEDKYSEISNNTSHQFNFANEFLPTNNNIDDLLFDAPFNTPNNSATSTPIQNNFSHGKEFFFFFKPFVLEQLQLKKTRNTRIGQIIALPPRRNRLKIFSNVSEKTFFSNFSEKKNFFFYSY